MSKEQNKEPALTQPMSLIANLKMDTVFRSKNIHQYAELIYWMLRALKEQGDIKDTTLAAIKLHLDAIRNNMNELESEIYEFINKTTKRTKNE